MGSLARSQSRGGGETEAKIAKLVELEGFEDETALFAASMSDCDYTAEMEREQDQGWCEACERGTLVSGLVRGGLI